MEITFSQAQGRVPVTIMRLKGDFDYMSADAFDREARRAVQNGATNFLIDLSEVPFMSSVGLRSIYTLYDLVHPVKSEREQKAVHMGVTSGTYKAPHLKLLKPADRVHESMKFVGLDLYVDIFFDEPEALSAFTQ